MPFTWNPPSDLELAHKGPVRLDHPRRLRDMIRALAAGDTGADVPQTGWHPYNMAAIGDGNDGLIYDFAVSGAVASVVSPDFVDGYEYRFRLEGVSVGTPANAITIDLYRETSAAYANGVAINSPGVALTLWTGEVEVLRPRVVSRMCVLKCVTANAPSNIPSPFNVFTTPLPVPHSTPQKILRARITFPGNTVGGKLYMDRRRAIA